MSKSPVEQVLDLLICARDGANDSEEALFALITATHTLGKEFNLDADEMAFMLKTAAESDPFASVPK